MSQDMQISFFGLAIIAAGVVFAIAAAVIVVMLMNRRED
jgi:hypothetical protein